MGGEVGRRVREAREGDFLRRGVEQGRVPDQAREVAAGGAGVVRVEGQLAALPVVADVERVGLVGQLGLPGALGVEGGVGPVAPPGIGVDRAERVADGDEAEAQVVGDPTVGVTRLLPHLGLILRTARPGPTKPQSLESTR